LSFPGVWFIASTRKSDAMAASVPITRNARVGLNRGYMGTVVGHYSSQPACWKSRGTSNLVSTSVLGMRGCRRAGEHGRTGGEAGPGDGADEQGHAAPEADCWVAQHCRRPRTESPCGLRSSSSSSSLVQALSRLPLFPDVLRIARKI
jgi:hypothetical protein